MPIHLLPAVAMMLGWGLRGFIGGGPFGAMIPGAMVWLAIAVREPRRELHLLAAFAAIGVGFGGEMTYGQTVGFSVAAGTFWWGVLGLTLKGAVWGALAGAVLALGVRAERRLVAWVALAMVVATEVGWKLINEPKLIYFSNREDRPRPEIWAGFALAALVAMLLQPAEPARRFVLAGLIGGGIGFGTGGAIQGLGRIFLPDEKWIHWWKYMEFTFGFCFGWALSWAFSHSRLPSSSREPGGRPAAWMEALAAIAVAAFLFTVAWKLPLRYAYLLAGCVVLVLVTLYDWLAPQVAYSVTALAFFWDSARYWSREYKLGAVEPAYAVATLAGLAFAVVIWRWRERPARDLLNLLTWVAVGDALLKFAMRGVGALADQVAVEFVLMAVAVSWMAARMPSRKLG